MSDNLNFTERLELLSNFTKEQLLGKIRNCLGENYFEYDFYKDSTVVQFDTEDIELLKKIVAFIGFCQDLSFFNDEYEEYGVNGLFVWDLKYGFVINRIAEDKFHTRETITNCAMSGEDLPEELKKHITLLIKAKVYAAFLISLKDEMKLPGPVQEIVFDKKDKNIYLREMPKEDNDELQFYWGSLMAIFTAQIQLKQSGIIESNSSFMNKLYSYLRNLLVTQKSEDVLKTEEYKGPDPSALLLSRSKNNIDEMIELLELDKPAIRNKV